MNLRDSGSGSGETEDVDQTTTIERGEPLKLSFAGLVRIAGLAASLFLLGTAAAASFREVSFDTQDKGHIHGNLYGEGDHAIVLAHGAIFNKESWEHLATRLASEGHEVLAIDFRGYGKSKAGNQAGALYLDVLGAVEYLHLAGAKRVSVVGGSMGGGVSAEASVASEKGRIDRLILLAATPIRRPGNLKGNKLFIVSAGDGLAGRVKQQFEKAPEPKKLVVLEGNAHAQHIFKTGQGAKLTQLIVDWLRD